MSDAGDQNIEAIGKLIQLTQKGKVEWNSVDPDVVQSHPPEDMVNSVFICNYKDKLLRIYHRKYKSYPGLGLSFFSINEKSPKEKKWFSEVVLELIDDSGNSVWQFPKERILHDLLDAVKYKASGASDVIQSLLDENNA